MRRYRTLVAVVVLSAFLSAACAEKEGDSRAVGAHLDATATEPHRFVYTETTPSGVETVVQGIVEDDFRYKARLLVQGEPILDRIVYDDLAAVRFLDPDRLGRYIDKDVVSFVDTTTDLDGINVFTALQSGRWVVDPGGAPPILQSVDERTDNGVDPIFDASRVLDVARELSLLETIEFVKYSENTISPTYRTDEDPFPRPEAGSGVTRYDLPQPSFPTSVGRTEIFLPGEWAFRKFSVYVKDDKVIRVAEQVGLAPTVLDDFETFMVQLINQTAPQDVAAGFEATLEELEGAELGQFMLDSLNTLHELQGDPPVRFRTAIYELLDIGDGSLSVDPPAEDTITGNLAVLLNLGVKPVLPDDDSADVSEDEDDAPEVVTAEGAT